MGLLPYHLIRNMRLRKAGHCIDDTWCPPVFAFVTGSISSTFTMRNIHLMLTHLCPMDIWVALVGGNLHIVFTYAGYFYVRKCRAEGQCAESAVRVMLASISLTMNVLDCPQLPRTMQMLSAWSPWLAFLRLCWAFRTSVGPESLVMTDRRFPRFTDRIGMYTCICP